MFISSNRPILQRRDSLSKTLQATLDGFAVIGLAWWLISIKIGQLTPKYAIMVLLLIGVMAIIYDQLGIYRSNASFTHKVLKLFNAWTLSFAFLLFLAFATKQTEYFSRVLVFNLYLLGFLVQLLLRLLVDTGQKVWLDNHKHTEHALILGQGQLADYLANKVRSNPWLGQEIIGAISLGSETSDDETNPDGELQILGDVTQLPKLIDEHQVKTVYIVTPLDGSSVLEKVYFTLLDKHITVHWVPDIFSLRLVNHSVREIAGIPLLTLSETWY